MIDYFALLQQPRRPWLDPDELKQKYRQLTVAAHPDRQPRNLDSSPVEFASINEAYRVLNNPKLRLQHLLSLEGIRPSTAATPPPEELTELFLNAGILVNEIDRVVAKERAADNALSKSVLRPYILEKQKRANDVLDKLKALYNTALRELQTLDQTWVEQPQKVSAELQNVYRRLAYLTKWIDQLEERRFQLSI